MKINGFLKLIISNDQNGFYGPGLIKLLQLIKENNSIKESAKSLGLSYSKALKLLNKAEKDFGLSLVEKTRGGSLGGETQITETGEKLIESYGLLENSLKESLKINFDRYFSWLEEVINDKVE